ncbi:type 1 glutamine amidotransferase family protein [Melghirimyces algeriensis]|uniref:Intracellular protease/amidase n=1 Tax=Melghirimyces algeriensis TaxID=910412 RepID=A0A521E282_9BACL|nr:type 1 glutamine amidotransferase family protein [Melghirimyces algeriensis]SMO78058.1 Putative intracellular protease/amidase [Melghirimyces algeriensis]
MKKVIFFILDEYADWEGAYLAPELMKTGKYVVQTASLRKTPVKSIGGWTTLPNYDITNIPNDYEAIILIGGNSWGIDDHRIVNLIKDSLENRVVTGAICGAVDFMAKNGLLNEYKHTGNSLEMWSEYQRYTNRNHFIRQQAVRDRNLVTANGSASLEFAKEILQALHAMDHKEIHDTYAFYKLGYYEFLNKH